MQSTDMNATPHSTGPWLEAAADALPAHVHLLGAGGAGVSGIGRVLAARGVRVSGHDHATSEIYERFASSPGVELLLGPSSAAVLPASATIVVRSVAVPTDDPQVVEAERRGIPVLKYSTALGRLAAPRQQLAVAGTHGKTTGSWMLWHTLEAIDGVLGRPMAGALIGGLDARLVTNAIGGGRDGWFVLEACEYDRTFLALEPFGAVISNVEEDHLDCYGDLAGLHAGFARFAGRVANDGLLVVGKDVPPAVEHAAGATVWRAGRDFDVELLGEEQGAFRFRLLGPGWATHEIPLGVVGHMNVDNAALAAALAIGVASKRSGVAPSELVAAAGDGLARFHGVSRRFERWGSVAGIHVVHDYAHHPTEVRATLDAARRAYRDRQLHVLFQPHQHSRTARFLEEFAESLRAADRIVVSDVYGARKHIDGERFAGAPELVTALRVRGAVAEHGGGLVAASAELLRGLPKKALVLVIGAGDVEQLRVPLLADLELLRSSSSRT
ncbi:MAG: cyanophycin synthetase [Planctomycetota bacterium]